MRDREESEKLFHQFKERIFDVANDSIAPCMAPLVQIKDDRHMTDCRTAIFFQIDQMKFLATAAHGMAEFLQAHQPPYIVMPKEPKMYPIGLCYETFLTTKNEDEDLCVALLMPPTVDYLADHYQYLRLNAMMPKKDKAHGKGLYMLLGYPTDRYEKDEAHTDFANSWKYITTQYTGDYGNVSNYDPDTHLIVQYERSTETESGTRVHPPGLSGCGLWYIGSPFTHPVFRPQDFKLAGIQTAWHKGHEYAKCTWTNVLMRIVWEYFPAAHGPMRLHGITF